MIEAREAGRILKQPVVQTTVLEAMQLVEFIQEAEPSILVQLGVPKMIVESRTS